MGLSGGSCVPVLSLKCLIITYSLLEETNEIVNPPKERINKKKAAKELRNKGEDYVSVSTNKVVQGSKKLKERCNSEICANFAHECRLITEEDRKNILDDFYNYCSSLQLQREFIVRHVSKKRKRNLQLKANQDKVLQ